MTLPKYVEIIDPTLQKLTDFAKANPYGSLFHTGDMVNVYQDSKDVEVIKLAAIDSKKKNILATLIMPLRRIPKMPKKLFFGNSRVSMPLFYPDKKKSIDAARSLLQEYDCIAKKNVVYSKIRMTFDKAKSKCDIWAMNDYSFDGFDNFVISLKNGEEEVIKGISKKIMRRIRQGDSKFEFKSYLGKKSHDIPKIHKLIESTYTRSNLGIPDISHFEAIFKHLVENGLANIHLVEYQNKPVSGMITLLFKNIIYGWYLGSSYEFKNIPSSEYLTWSVLKWSLDKKYDYFDWGGNGDPKKFLGFREYKRKFGGDTIDYGIYNKVQKANYYKIIEAGKKIMKYGIKKGESNNKNKNGQS
jgi:hypothetical protein